MPVEQEVKTFKDIETEYDQLFLTEPVRDEDRAYRWFAKLVTKYCPAGTHFVDLACGGGYFFQQLDAVLEKRGDLTGIDISGQALQLAGKSLASAHWVQGIAENLPFPDNQFDGLTCLGSMEHFMNIPGAIAEMKRVVKPGGLILILVPNIFWYKDIISVLFTGNRKTRNQTHERFASLEEWKETLRESGLNIVKTVKYNGIARRPAKQWLKDLVIPLRFSYHFIFLCENR